MTYNKQCQKLNLTEPVYGKMKRIKVYLLDEPDTCNVLNINPRNCRSWSQVLKHITETLKPAFGAVLRLYELSTDKFIENFDQLTANRTYVALGAYGTVKKTPGRYTLADKREVFKPRERTQLYLGETDPKMQDFLDETERKGLTVIYVMTNGVTLQVPQKVVFRKHELQSWDPIIRFLDKKLDIPEGVERIATIFGDILLEPRELQHGFVYVALQPLKPFVELDYLELFKYLCSNYRGNYILSIEPAPIQTSEVVRRRTMSTVEPLTSFAGTTSRLSEFDIEQRKSRTSERKMSMPFSRSREPSTTSKRSFNPNSTAGASRTAASNRKTSTVSVEPRKSNISHIDDDNVDQQRKSVMSYRRKSSAKGAMDQNKIIPTRPSIMSEKRKSRTSVAPRVSYVNNVEGYNDTVQQQESFLSNKTVPDDDEVEEELAQLIPTESTAEQTISKTRASQTYKQSKSPEMINEDSELITESRINNRFNGKSVQSVIDPEFKEKKSVTKPPTSCPNFRECDCPEIESDISVTNIQKRMSKSTTVNVPGSKRATRPTIMNQLPEVESVVSARGNEEFEDDSPTYCPVYKDCNCAEISNEIARRNTNRPTAIDISALDCKCQDEATQNDLENSMDELPVKQSAPKIPSIPEKKRTSTIADNKRGEKRKSRTQDQENRQSRKSLSRKSLNNENEFNGNAVLTRDTGQSRRSIPGQIIQSIPFQIQDSRSYIANCECDNVSGQTTERCNRNKLPADRSEFFEGGGYTAEQRYSTIKFKSQSQMSQAQRRSVSKRSINPLDTEDSEYEGNIIQTGNVGRSTVKTAPSSSRRSLGKDEFDGDETFRSRHQTQMSQAQRRSVSKRSISPLETEESEYEGNIIQTGNVGRSTVKTAPSSSRRSLGKDEFDGDEAFRSRHQTQMSQAQRRSVSKRSISPLDTEESEYEGNIIQTGNVGRSTVKTAPSSSRRSLGKDEFDGDEAFRSRHQTQMSQAQRRSVSKRSISPLDTEESEYEGNIIQTGNVGRSTVKTAPSSSRRSLGKDEFDGDETFRSRHQTQMSQAQRRSVSKRSISPLDTEESEYEGNIIQTGNVGRSTVKAGPSSSRRSLGKDEFDGDETFRSRHQTQMSQAQRRSVSKRSISPLETEESEYEGNIIQTGNVGRSTVKTAPSSSRRSLGKDEFDGDEAFRSRHQTQMSQAQRRSVSKRSISPLDTEESEYEGNIIQTGNVGRSTVKTAPSSSRRSLGKDEFDGDEAFRSRHQTQMSQAQRRSVSKRSISPLDTEESEYEGNIIQTGNVGRSTVKTAPSSSRRSLGKDEFDGDETFRSRHQTQMSQAQRRSVSKRSISPLDTEESEYEGNIIQTGNVGRSTVKAGPSSSRRSLGKDEFDGDETFRSRHQTQMSQAQRRSVSKRSISPLDTEESEYEGNIIQTGNVGRSTVKAAPSSSRRSLGKDEFDGDETFRSRHQTQIPDGQRHSTFKHSIIPLPIDDYGNEGNIVPTDVARYSTTSSRKSLTKRQSQISQAQRRSTLKQSVISLPTEEYEPERSDGTRCGTLNTEARNISKYPVASGFLKETESTKDVPDRRQSSRQSRISQMSSTFKVPAVENCECEESIEPTGDTGYNTFKPDTPCTFSVSVHPVNSELNKSGDCTIKVRRQSQIAQAKRRSTFKSPVSILPSENRGFNKNIDPSRPDNSLIGGSKQSVNPRCITIKFKSQSQMSQTQRRSVAKRSINPLDTEDSEYEGNIIQTGNVGRSTVKAAPSSSRRSLGKDEFDGDETFRSRHQTQMPQAQRRSVSKRSINPMDTEESEYVGNIIQTGNVGRSTVKAAPSSSRRSLGKDEFDGDEAFRSRHQTQMSQAQRRSVSKRSINPMDTEESEYVGNIIQTGNVGRSTVKAAPSSSRRSLGKDEFDGDEAFRSRHQTQMSQAQRRSVSKRSINPMDTEESEYVGNIIQTGNVGRSTVKAAPSSSRRSLGKDEYYGDDVQRSQTFKSGHPLPIDDFEPAEKILPIVRSRRNNFKSETSISRKSFTTSPSAENANEDTARGRSTIKARLESKISQAQRNTTFKAPVSLLPDPNCDCEEVILPTTPNRRATTKQVKRISKFPGTDRPPEEWGPARSRYDTIKSELKRSVDTNCECEDIDQKPRNANSTFPSTDPYPDNLELGEYTEKTDFVGEDQTYCTQTKKVIVDKSASCPLVSVTILCKEECRSKSSEVGTSQTDTSYINENEPTKKDDSLCCCMTNENQSENTGIVAKYVNETCGTANQNCRNPNSQQSPGTHNDSEPYEDFKCNKNVKFCQLQNQNALPCGQNSVCPKNVRDRNQMLSYPCSECQDEQEPPALEGVCGRGRICDTNKDIVLKLQILCNKHEEESKVVSCSCKDQEAELEPEPEELPEFEDEPEPEPDEYPEPEEELEAEPEERYEEEPEDDLDLEEQPEQEPEEQYEWEPDGMEPEPEEPTLDQEYEEDLNIEPNEKERRKTQRISNKGPMPMMTTSRAFMKTETRLSCTRCRRFCCGCSVQYFKYGS